LSERELLIPTSARRRFPVEQAHVTEINGRPVGKTIQRSYLTYAFSVLGLAGVFDPVRIHGAAGLPVGLQIRGQRRGEAAVARGRRGVRGGRPWAPHVPRSSRVEAEEEESMGTYSTASTWRPDGRWRSSRHYSRRCVSATWCCS